MARSPVEPEGYGLQSPHASRRVKRLLPQIVAAFALLGWGLAAPARGNEGEPAWSGSPGPRLTWIRLSPEPETRKVGVSLLLETDDASPWLLEARAFGKAHGSRRVSEHRQTLAHGVLTFFRLGPLDFGEHRIELQLSQVGGAGRGLLVIPFDVGAEAGPEHVLVPEHSLSPAAGETPRWHRWMIEPSAPTLARLEVVSRNGHVVQSWLPGMLLPGLTAVLWDSRAGAGRPDPSEDGLTLRLSVEPESSP